MCRESFARALARREAPRRRCCDDPGQGCGDCHDCANPTPACTEDGTCGPCVVDDDCCPPLVCDAGICKAIIPQ